MSNRKMTGMAVGGKCYICGKTLKGSLIIIERNEQKRHVWCKPDELSEKS